MKHMPKSTNALFFFAALLVPALFLSGCAGSMSFPDTVVPGTAQQTPVGTIKGSAYGGHAPIVGAHVYVLEPQSTAYGNYAKSLISSTASGATVNVSDPGLPTTAYYVTTDSTGSFNLTGDYTCDAGYPVYLYSYSGTPETTSGYPTYNISSVAVSGSGSSWTYTFTTTTNSFAYIGETVRLDSTFGSFPSGNTAYVVSSPSPTSNTFTLGYSSGTAGTTNYSSPYPTVDFEPHTNPGIVELAVLGICPTSGSIATGGPIFNGTTSSALKFVYMNEVSTVAAAYAFAPFSAQAYYAGQNFPIRYNYASSIGTSSTNLVGLQNAALNAGLLYSVNGSGALSTSFAGEGHIANAATPTGNGIINNVVIDTLANILASCVDSQSTNITVGSSGTSTQCSTLFQYATNTGIPTSDTSPGLQPYDTATAAINIALHPQGPPSTDTTTTPSAWVAALYNLPTGVVPFTPNLTNQPNDFTIGILYTAANNPASQASSYFNGITGVAVDKIGEVWFNSEPSTTSGWVFKMLPQGVIDTGAVYWNGTYTPGPPVIDSNENIWYHTQDQQGPVYFISTKSTSGNPYTYNNYTTATPDSNGYFYSGTVSYFGDNNGNMYFVHDQTAPGASGSSTSVFQLSKFPAISGGSSTDAGEVNIANLSNTNYPISAAVLDEGGYMWLTQNAGSGTSTIERTGQVPNNVGQTPIFSLAGSSNCAGIDAPTSLAITRGSNAVMANSAQYAPTFVTQGGTCTFLQNSTGMAVNRQGPGSYFPVAEATDGNDYVYSLNQEAPAEGLNSHQGSITVFNLQGETGSSIYAMNYAWSPVYYPSGSSTLTSLLSYPQSLALDPSGNIWVVNSTTSGNNPNSVVEIIGAAGPTTTPISSAVCASQGSCYGYKP